METSPRLRHSQLQALTKVLGAPQRIQEDKDPLVGLRSAEFSGLRVDWRESPFSIKEPEAGPLVVVANEFFDALPVDLYQVSFHCDFLISLASSLYFDISYMEDSPRFSFLIILLFSNQSFSIL